MRSLRLPAVLLAAVLALSACASAAPADGAARTIENCGHEVRVTKPPQRAVALNQGSAEIMLSLGLADRMAGTATWTDPVLPDLAADNAKVPRLAENNPSFETVLATEPDFVAASFGSTLGRGGVATREQFEQLGVPTYLAPADCALDTSGGGDGKRTETLTMDPVYTEIRDLARIFEVEDRGEQLVASLQERMRAAAGTDASNVSLMYWFANSEAPYLAGCCGSPGIMTATLHARNVFDDTHDEWPQINWETVAARNPDVIVLGDLTRRSQTAETAQAKIAFLESHPVTRDLAAVRNKRYVLLSGQAMNPTLRTVDGTEQVAAALRGFGLAG
ncbi:ABC transporter substrate-binding protein [Amycolatopsis endophytica]|uniref:Iron complex transport system substrate-binding protein n=1 Tax=Amycolatopsis endophytica TaxID=860233 RepID=A0A853B847_9PSEU|nr:ABC transporter substrate-binding protein [Amycolatopsis endophytica]NYI90965.1 iron complex transport system substrate-binding protein [Amycolatopsis endophytica]